MVSLIFSRNLLNYSKLKKYIKKFVIFMQSESVKKIKNSNEEEKMNTVLQFYPFKIFKVNNHSYIYATDFGGLFEVDDDTLSILAQEGSLKEDIYKNLHTKMDRNKIDNILKQMEDYHFLKTELNDKYMNDYQKSDLENSVHSLALFVAQDCNMRCKYCYGDGGSYADKGTMSYETAKAAIDFLFEQTNDDKDLSVTFFGGEPLMNFGLIQKITEYIRVLEKNMNKKCYLNMTSNATLLSEEIISFCEKNRIAVQISIDGNKRVQNTNRYFVNQKGSYDCVLDKTKKWRDKECVSCRATVTACSLNITDSFYHLDALGFRSIMFAPAENLLSDKEYEELDQQYLDYLDEFERLVKTGDYKRARKAKLIMGALPKIEKSGIRSLACGVGRNMYAIDINGDVYPCQRFVNNKEYCLGNIFERKFKQADFLESIHISAHSQCKNCWVKNLCLGNCPHDNLISTQRVNSTSERVCRHQRSFYERLIKIYIGMTDDEKRMLYAKS